MTYSPVFGYPIIVSTFLPLGLSPNQVALLNQHSRLFLWLSYMGTSTYREHSCIPRPGQLWISKITPYRLYHLLPQATSISYPGAVFRVPDLREHIFRFLKLSVEKVAHLGWQTLYCIKTGINVVGNLGEWLKVGNERVIHRNYSTHGIVPRGSFNQWRLGTATAIVKVMHSQILPLFTNYIF